VSWSRAGTSSLFLLFIFVLQEAAISKVNLPIGGFSLYLAVLLGLMALEDRSGAVVLGFVGGLILDLSPSQDSPVGKWAFVLTVIGYFFATNRESIGDFTNRPIAFVFFTALGSVLALCIFLVIGLLLGETNGSVWHNLVTVFGNGIWTLIFSPILLPLLVKWRGLTLTSRERQ
jgi:rod shape-determining protein MreD